ncbi:esterase family protein [Anaerofilum sp. BX8]|uniref:Esterase family protein n=1 Tax=Anaerofilum hominis TaxID=2763016 RepID=A0A923I5H0_9FIRM|nr:alpha/beta hydrolase family protein [Anaerofilum hominis]MBC5580681.1 esterase family protein [Anaerofilum hominis]
MAFIQMNFYSDALKFSTDVNIILPTPSDVDAKGGEPYFEEGAKYQVLYLLHGTYADHHDWTRLSSIERYAQEAKVMVVLPSGENSFWQDMYIGPNYFTYITEELPRFIRTIFPVSTAREDTFIGGLSMGAFGALNAAVRCPEKYAAAICLSGGMSAFRSLPATEEELAAGPWPFKAILPPPYDGKGTGMDDIPIIQKLAASGQPVPRLYFAVGTEDFVYGNVVKTRAFLDEVGIPYTYEEGPGVHNWTFWDEYIQHGLKWLGLRGTTLR